VQQENIIHVASFSFVNYSKKWYNICNLGTINRKVGEIEKENVYNRDDNQRYPAGCSDISF
jgi:hypothetical protein